jgi:thiol:disulfide interchange protein
MKRLFVVFITILFCCFGTNAQLLYPAKWTYSTEKTKEGEATLIFKVKIDKGWHVYSQYTPQDSKTGLAPIPLLFEFEKNKNYTLVGKTEEPPTHEAYDSTFEVKILTFETEATFRQKIKINSEPLKIKGKISGQVCQDACMQIDTGFVFTFGKETKEEIKSSIEIKDTSAQVAPQSVDTSASTVIEAATPPSQSNLEEGCGNTGSAKGTMDKSLLGIFIAGMLGGFLALLTPCVFPMIPLTVSFFTKRSGSRKKGMINALIYAASIIIIYVTLGLLVTIIFGSDALNDLASNGFFNMLFFIIFLIFAISFFGAFEITLPSSFINKADSASDKGGLIGIFFMAFTLSLVSFSCTGPIIGTLLVEAASGSSFLGPAAGMSGFAFALALPFALFAMFPGWLNSLPKSGGWLNTVKVSLGFIELALAFKFLSNVDLAYHWNFLKREIFIVIWIILSAMWGFYLLGKLRFSHDSDVPHISISRLLFAIVALAFALYLVPGLWGAPLKLISGFPPPQFYTEWQTSSSQSECPHNLTCFHDYEEGMRYAKSQNKPVMIDFTGWSCVNCRKMEDNVWSDPKVLNHLTRDYVLISLYVDDKQDLPLSEQTVSPTTGKKIKTTGNKWSDMQAHIYNTNSQPYYVLLDNKAKILAEPRGYTPDIKEYISFLDEGLCRYQKRKADNKLVAEKY